MNSDGSGCKVIYEKGLPNILGNVQIFSHIFPYIWGKFYFIFLSVCRKKIAKLLVDGAFDSDGK